MLSELEPSLGKAREPSLGKAREPSLGKARDEKNNGNLIQYARLTFAKGGKMI